MDILQLRCRAENGINVKNGFAELLQLGNLVVPNIQNIDGEEGILVHLVGVVQIRVKPVILTIGQNGKLGGCGTEVAEELGVVPIQVFCDSLALHQNDRLSVLHDGIIDLFALLDADISGKLRDKFLRIEDIIAKHGKERHNQRSLGSFLCLQAILHRVDSLCKLFQLVNEIHNTHSPISIRCVRIGHVLILSARWRKMNADQLRYLFTSMTMPSAFASDATDFTKSR